MPRRKRSIALNTGDGLQETRQPAIPAKRQEKIKNFRKLYRQKLSSLDEALYQLRQLSNREYYEYSAEDVQLMIAFILSRVQSLEESFCTGKKTVPFRLPSARVENKEALQLAMSEFGYTPPNDTEIEIAGIIGDARLGEWPEDCRRHPDPP